MAPLCFREIHTRDAPFPPGGQYNPFIVKTSFELNTLEPPVRSLLGANDTGEFTSRHLEKGLDGGN